MKGLETASARTRLRLGIVSFILALAVPSLLLVDKAYDQIKWESFRQQQIAAEAFAARVDDRLADLVRQEDARGIDDYGFASGDAGRGYRRRSPLSDLSASQGIPGLIGWFQVRADGRFSSPIVPEPDLPPSEFGIDPSELALRQAQAQRIEGILIGNRLVERGARELDAPVPDPVIVSPSETTRSRAQVSGSAGYDEAQSYSMQRSAPPAVPGTLNKKLSQAAFERLAAEDEAPAAAIAQKIEKQTATTLEGLEKPKSRIPERLADEIGAELEFARPGPAPPMPEKSRMQSEETSGAQPVQLFDTAIEPMEVGRLDSGHFLLFRSVWRNGERIIQGALIEQRAFLERVVGDAFEATALARTSDLALGYRGALLTRFHATPGRQSGSGQPALSGTLLYRTRMQEPFGGLELVFSVTRLPDPPGAAVIGWMATALALVLVGGGWLMYRLGMGQIELMRQQQDFVSSVSHELKTPLTSIRMYAEMLSAGFAAEHRKQTYYRLIHEESERLSRLIANVLQLARIGRDAQVLEIQPVGLEELLRTVRERVSAQVERAGFALEIGCGMDAWVQVDPDALVQIFINLIDNALKFSAESRERRIRIGCEPRGERRVCLSVRDFGPGIPRGQRARVFQLFYRGEEAKRRAISGTGIGLALVRRLTLAMEGRVEVVNRDPGAEFRIELPLIQPPGTRKADAG
ncbi:sensor histidine kinase [Imhoffiella purpurea]|uniref:histidine kinase n=1 Tax=Imhoffiella purpurea TaxID=1249627 RepID=W9V3X9_9GAMM|nr:HAMP domain-containing sensor histidine kinase [Imhoffiella purpurea]EXJ14228.1 hypothetical protein D779_2899 [Imhoffiella purpurea]